MYSKVKSKPRLKRAAEGHFFKRLLFAFINAERYMTPQLIADLIAHELTIPRKHKPLLRNINALFDAVHSRYILGYKIVVDGKLNGVMKSTKQIIKFKGKDKMPVQEFDQRVLYALGISRTYTGLFGVRV
jgi:ribosomal protein S3